MEGGVEGGRGGDPALGLAMHGGARPKRTACTRVTFRNSPFLFSILDDVFNRLDEKDVRAIDRTWGRGGVGAFGRPGFLA